MTRLTPRGAAAGAVLATLLAACGGTGAAGTPSSSGSSPTASGAGRFARNGSAGELVRLQPPRLILNTQNGDVTVTFSTSTPVTRTDTGSVSDIAAGKCIVAAGQKDAAGAVTASVVRLSDPTNGSCAGRGVGDGGTPRPGATPGPGASPRPGNPFGLGANGAVVRGIVTAVSATVVTVKDSAGASRTLTVPTTVSVSETSDASTTDLEVGQCIIAAGARDSSGTIAARTLAIVPPGPTGCLSGRGGFGFGLGGRGGGAGATPAAE